MAWYRCVGGAGGSLKLRTASGRIATFSTNMVEAFKSLKSDINPVQDLHGYSKPWIGGGGKNKYCNIFSQYTQPSDYRVFPIALTQGQTYKLWASLKGSAVSGCVVAIVKDGTRYSNFVGFTQVIITTGSINEVPSFTVDATFTNPKLVVYASTETAFNSIFANYNVQLEVGNQATAYEPYSNICPISGFSALNVTRTGKNLFSYDLTIRNGYWGSSSFVGDNSVVAKSSATGWQYIRIFVKGLSKITLSGFDTVGGTNCAWLSSDNPNDFISFFNSGSKNGTKTVPNNAVYLGLVINNIKACDTSYPNAQLEVGESVSTFEPYNGQTASVNFGQTVYGGVLDVTNGKLTITHKYKLLTGDASETWYTYGDSGWRLVVSDQKGDGGEGWCNVAPTVSSVNVYGVVFGISTTYIYFAQTVSAWGCSTEAQLRTWLGNNNVEIVYPLATPIEITLTPKQIEAIVGINNVYHDCNGETEVKYLYRG